MSYNEMRRQALRQPPTSEAPHHPNHRSLKEEQSCRSCYQDELADHLRDTAPSEPSLRELLARRLISVKWAIDYSQECAADVEIDPAQGPIATWGDLADECIRQMEWARTGWVECKDNNGSSFYSRGASTYLTLAPEDWKP
jgi:hypothetical protein